MKKKAAFLSILLITCYSFSQAQVNINIKTPKLGSGKNKNENTAEGTEQKKDKETGTKRRSQEEITRILDKSSYPNYNKDEATLKRINDLYLGGKPTWKYEEAILQVGKYNEYKDSVAKIGTQYQEYWEVHNTQMGYNDNMYRLYEDAGRLFKSFDGYITNSVANTDYHIKAALDMATEWKNKKRTEDDAGKNVLTDPSLSS